MPDYVTLTIFLDDADDLMAALQDRPYNEQWSDRVLTALRAATARKPYDQEQDAAHLTVAS